MTFYGSELPRRTFPRGEEGDSVERPERVDSIADIDWMRWRWPWPEEKLPGRLLLGPSVTPPFEIPKGHALGGLLQAQAELIPGQPGGVPRKALKKEEAASARERARAGVDPDLDEHETKSAYLSDVRRLFKDARLEAVAGTQLWRLGSPLAGNDFVQGQLLQLLALHRQMTASQLCSQVDRGRNTVDKLLKGLLDRGLVRKWAIRTDASGSNPVVWELTKDCWKVLETADLVRPGGPPDSLKRGPREAAKLRSVPHDLVAVELAIHLTSSFLTLGAAAAPFRTPALTTTCHLKVPSIDAGASRLAWAEAGDQGHDNRLRFVGRAKPRTATGTPATTPANWDEGGDLHPDITIDVTGPGDYARTVRLWIEVDLKRGKTRNVQKVVAYDRAISGWLHRHSQFHPHSEDPSRLDPITLRLLTRELATGAPTSEPKPSASLVKVVNRPLVIFVMQNEEQMLELRAQADIYAIAQACTPYNPPRYVGRHAICFSTMAATTDDKGPCVIGLSPLPPYERASLGLIDDEQWHALVPPSPQDRHE